MQCTFALFNFKSFFQTQREIENENSMAEKERLEKEREALRLETEKQALILELQRVSSAKPPGKLYIVSISLNK